jgi:hypothetical protein
MENCKGQRTNFMGSVDPKEAAEHVTEIVDVLFSCRALTYMIIKEKDYAEQFIHGRDLSIRSPNRKQKPVTEGEICCTGSITLTGITRKPTLRSTPGFADIITTRHTGTNT